MLESATPGRESEKPREYCGLCGVINCSDILEKAYLGLHSLQHRGQEAAGLMAGFDDGCRLHRGKGLVDDVFLNIPASWTHEEVSHAISHVRYSTAGGPAEMNAQPLMADLAGVAVGIAHNGTICNSIELLRQLQAEGAIFQTSSDTELVLHLIARCLSSRHNGDLWGALEEALRHLQGAYSFLLMTRDHMAAVRDPYGFRPLVIGAFPDGGWMAASETIALEVVGARYMREVEPGEIVIWEKNSDDIVSRHFAASPRRAHCIFEHVYFARPGSFVFGDSVYEVRKRMGRQLAAEWPVEADVITPIPDSGMYAGLGFAEASGIPFEMGLTRNHYVGRTFIQPGNLVSRHNMVRRKLHPINEALRGRRVCLIEDSIVRGSTSRARIQAIRDSGAAEVHMRVSCPPHRFGCWFGIDFPENSSLLANQYRENEMADILGLDSLGYLSREGMLSCVKAHPPEDYCCACFNGQYPVRPKNAEEIKDAEYVAG